MDNFNDVGYLILFFTHYVLKVSGTDILDCNFDQNFCNWKQSKDDDFDWTRNSGRTPTVFTGPNADHTSGDGTYVYIDTSADEVEKEDKAWLVSPDKNPGIYCFSFWYYMYGRHVETLRASTVVGDTCTQLFEIRKNRGKRWELGYKQFNASNGFKIVIEGRVTNSDSHDHGDIAVDDIVMFSGQCAKGCDNPTPEFGLVSSKNFGIGSVVEITCLTGYAIKGSSVVACLTNGTWSGKALCIVSDTDKLDCNFDQDLCKWNQSTHDDFDWTRFSGETPTEHTGPNADHTSGGGFYVYLDTNSKEVEKKDKARLVSPLMNPGTYCFSFWYYMYGEHVDTLRAYVDESKLKTLFAIRGNQGQIWKLKRKTFNATKRFKIVIDGRVRNSDSHDFGDIAVDDIVMLSGQCPTGCEDPTPTFGVVNSTNFKIGSVVGITCMTGYIIKGRSSVVCLANAMWSHIPECKIIDCGTRNITNGHFTATSGMTFGQTAWQSCNTGYIFTGDEAVVCTESGWNGTEAQCTIVDCFTPSIDNGKIAKSSDGTTYNSIAIMACVDGYKLHGNANVTCQADGNWTTLPSCIIINCSMPIIPHGNTSEIVRDTTYNGSVMLACADGYMLTGNRIVTCQADGNWTTLPKCHIQDSENNTLMIVYVVVPIAVIALFVGLFCIIRRKCSYNV